MTDQLASRIPEPELMEDMSQAKAYAEADFQEPHDMFVAAFKERFGPDVSGLYLDLGCGTADISCRFARTFPRAAIHGIDGSRAMLEFAAKAVNSSGLSRRITLFQQSIPTPSLPAPSYNGIIANSLLHHLAEPMVLWSTIRQWGRKDGPVFVMDLLRPETMEQARQIVERYSGNEPKILKQDFYHSLLAAYRPQEVLEQLKQAGLNYLNIETISDRHFIVWGRLK